MPPILSPWGVCVFSHNINFCSILRGLPVFLQFLACKYILTSRELQNGLRTLAKSKVVLQWTSEQLDVDRPTTLTKKSRLSCKRKYIRLESQEWEVQLSAGLFQTKRTKHHLRSAYEPRKNIWKRAVRLGHECGSDKQIPQHILHTFPIRMFIIYYVFGNGLDCRVFLGAGSLWRPLMCTCCLKGTRRNALHWRSSQGLIHFKGYKTYSSLTIISLSTTTTTIVKRPIIDLVLAFTVVSKSLLWL